MYRIENGSEELWFSRDESSPEGLKYNISEHISTNPERQNFFKFLSEATESHSLFLHEAGVRKGSELKFLYNWFKKSLVIVGPNSNYRSLAKQVDLDDEFKKFLSTSVRGIDANILDVFTESREIPLYSSSASSGKNDSASFLSRSLTARLSSDVNSIVDVVDSGEDKQLKIIELMMTRQGANREEVKFSFSDESDGTRRYINLMPAIFHSEETFFAIDELDRSLHPLLTRRFLEIFLEKAKSSDGNQLLFTTHEANLLNASLFEREQIWFVEKNREGGSVLYSLMEFDSEQISKLEENLEQGYLVGRFGAIPFFGSLRSFDEHASSHSDLANLEP